MSDTAVHEEQAAPMIEDLRAAGWYIKLAVSAIPLPGWKVWLRWPLPPNASKAEAERSKEESKRCDTLAEAAAWLQETADNWEHDDG